MKSSASIISTLMAAAILTTSGCVQHSFRFNLIQDNKIIIDYEARGDRVDLNDGLDAFPDSSAWNVTRRVEEKEDETIHIFEGSFAVNDFSRLNSVMNWGKSGDDSAAVQRYFEIECDKQLFGNAYYFNAKFVSRRFDDIYGDIWDFIPEECRALDDDDAVALLSDEEVDKLRQQFSLGVLQWNLRRYAERMIRVWEVLKARQSGLNDTTFSTFSIAYAGWSDDLRRYLNRLDITDPNTLNLEWWGDLRPLFTGRLIDVAGLESAELIGKIADAVERSYQISKDMKDDVFHISISLPGKIGHTNGETEEDNRIKWELSGENLLNETIYLEASTFNLSLWRVGFFAIIVLFMIRLIKSLVQSQLKQHSK